MADRHDYVYEDVRKYRRHLRVWAFITALLFAIDIYLIPPLWQVRQSGLQPSSIAQILSYLGSALAHPLKALAIHWDIVSYDFSRGTPPYFHFAAMLKAVITFGIFGIWRNPHTNTPWLYGKAFWATDNTIREMEARKQVGIVGGYLVTLGRWMGGKDRKGKYHRGELFQLIETLSVLCAAPSGAGKTASLVIPTIAMGDAASMVVHDCKPELWDATSGWRSKVGTALQLAWSAIDKPDEGIFYPRFNPLSAKVLPPPGDPRLNTVVDALVQIVITKEDKSDSYFTTKGRSALAGFIYFLIWKVNVYKDYDGIPDSWHGKEASFAMLTDWLAESKFLAKRKTDEAINKARDATEMMKANRGDPLGEWLNALADEARGREYAPRAFNEMIELANMADKERSGVLGTMDAALIVFKNPSVAERTSACDFSMEDLRGMKDPTDGKIKPLSVYLCVNQAEAKAFEVVTGLFCEIASKLLLSYGPGQTLPSGAPVGPFPVLFVLDEFPKLTRCDAVIEGPDLGRSKAVLYLLIAQDLSQIEMKYSKANIETIVSTTAAKLILPLNNEQTAKRFASMVGKTTVRRRSTSHQSGYTKEAVNLSSNVSDSYEGVDLITTDLLMAMQPGTQIVLVQNFMNQPVSLEGIRYWDDPVISVRTHNIKNPAASVGPPPAAPMPEWMRLLRVAEHRRDAIEKAARAEARERDRDAISTAAAHPHVASPNRRLQRHL